jgi:histone-lysine N-methyltransferase SETMAR
MVDDIAYLCNQCTTFHSAGCTCWFLTSLYFNRVSGLMQFLTADQKQQRVKVCEKLHQIASNNLTFLSRVFTGDESWTYSYDPETKQQSSQRKSPNSPRPKRVREVKSKVKCMLITFFQHQGACSQIISRGMPNSQFHILPWPSIMT